MTSYLLSSSVSLVWYQNTFRMIVDLSAPRGFSVNDGIREEICASVDQAVSLILRLGQGTMLVKLDMKEAYRIVPVHPHDQPIFNLCGSQPPVWASLSSQDFHRSGRYAAMGFGMYSIIWTTFCCSASRARWRQSRPSV